MRAARRPSCTRTFALAAALSQAALAPAIAENRGDVPSAPTDPPAAAVTGAYSQPPPWRAPRSGPVERGELAPLATPDGSGLPLELWQGLDLPKLEGLLAGLELPPRSPTLHALWRRMLKAAAAPPQGARDEEQFTALRLEALYRSGLLDDMGALLEASPAHGAVIDTLAARREIGLGRREPGCDRVKALAARPSGLPGRLKGEAQLLSGYCAAAAGDAAGAGLAVELAREEGLEAELPLAVLASIAAQSKPRLQPPRHVLLLDFRFLELLGPVDGHELLDRAEPALLVALAGDQRVAARVQLAATEAAVRVHALPAEALAEAYRRLAVTAGGAGGAHSDTPMRRALLYQAVELARTPAERIRALRALVEDGRSSDLSDALARLVAPEIARLAPTRELEGFAESAAEIALAAGDLATARAWASALPHWRELIEVVAPPDGRPAPRLAAVEELAATGRIDPEALHRLVTVLDALDFDVPIALWDTASRTPQPATGYLPDTGVLAELAEAVRRREVGRTILLVMRALGPRGPRGAHVLALRDGVHALQRVGLPADARRLALEALLPLWPQAAGRVLAP